jgi:hypothetical protein
MLQRVLKVLILRADRLASLLQTPNAESSVKVSGSAASRKISFSRGVSGESEEGGPEIHWP